MPFNLRLIVILINELLIKIAKRKNEQEGPRNC